MLVSSTGCQLKPTRGSESSTLDTAMLSNDPQAPIVIDENTVIVDARSEFQYSLAHPPGAIRMAWEDFARPNGKVIGLSTADVPALVKRLALKGITPQQKIVVVGNAQAGLGEEGRVAWSLLHLGFPNVVVVGVDYFKSGMNNANPPPRPNQPEWEAKKFEELEATRDEVLKIATSKLQEGDRQKEYIIDVRSKKEYFHKAGLGEGYTTPDLRAIHIPWEQFYTADGRPNGEMKNQLLALGIQPSDRLITISHHGVRSGAAAFALLKMGFSNVGNYTGGFQELLSSKKKGPKLRPLGK